MFVEFNVEVNLFLIEMGTSNYMKIVRFYIVGFLFLIYFTKSTILPIPLWI